MASSRAGGEVSFVACIGKDLLGDSAIDGFKKDNMNTIKIIKQILLQLWLLEIVILFGWFVKLIFEATH